MFWIVEVQAQTLRLLVWEGYFPEKHQAIFSKWAKDNYSMELNFKVSHVTKATDFFEKLRGGEVDIISPTHNLLKDERFNFIKKKLLIPIDTENIPNHKDLIPGLQKLKYTLENGKRYAIPFANGRYGLAYNTQLISEAPSSWQVFFDPQYQGKYAIISDYFEVNIYIAALAAGIAPDELSSYNTVNIPEVRLKLQQLRRNTASYWNGMDKAADLKGLPIAASWGYAFAELRNQGEVWKFAEPKEGTPWWVDSLAISSTLAKKPKLKKIAEILINYMISPEFQKEVIIENVNAITVNSKTELTDEKIKEFSLDDDPNTFSKRRVLWPTLTTRARNGFARIWREAGK
jgi:spermidine/putrescine transport system substrate-binding protein